MVEKPVRVLLVEDSLVAQNLLKGIIIRDSRFVLVAVAHNGKQAIDMVRIFKPDVVSMDIQMPVMDGVEATREILQSYAVPIVIVSSYYHSSNSDLTMQVLEAGAVSVLPRPFGPEHPQYAQTAREYLSMLKSMSQVKVVRRKKSAHIKNNPASAQIISDQQFPIVRNDFKIVVIGASAGGPEAVRTILTGLSSSFRLPILLVQHIDPHFTEGYCEWLNTTSNLPVEVAVKNAPLKPGHVYLPPSNKHLVVKSMGFVDISDAHPDGGLRPSVAALFRSTASVYGKESIAILLSGMGSDGVKELKILHDLGAFTIVQNQQSCLVYGMPGEAVKIGAAAKILSPEEIVAEITNMTK